MKQKKSSIALLVSRVFEPVIEIPAAIVLAVLFAVSNNFRWRFLVIILLIDAVMPFVFYLHLLMKKEISNWDVTNRKERVPLYLFTLIAHGVGLILALILAKGDLTKILLVFYLVAVVFFGVTTFWKISVHAGVNAVLVTFINILFGWQYWYLYVVVVLVGWSRVRNGHHTWMQVTMGAVVGAVGLWGGLRLLGVI